MMLQASSRPARLHYLSGTYRVLGSGDHVLCAVTSQRIPLANLRYWSSELQEPYANAAAAAKRYADAKARGKL